MLFNTIYYILNIHNLIYIIYVNIYIIVAEGNDQKEGRDMNLERFRVFAKEVAPGQGRKG